MKSVEHLDIEEIERLKICTHNLQLMQRHINRLEKYAMQIDDVLGLEKMDDRFKINAIARLTNTIKEFI